MQLYTVTLSVHSLMTVYCIFTNNGYYRNDYYRDDYNMRLFAILFARTCNGTHEDYTMATT